MEDMDATSTLLQDEFLDAIACAGKLDSTVFEQWLAVMSVWMIPNCMEADVPEGCTGVERDDRIIEVARHAAYRSFELVIQQLRQPSTHHSFSAKRTTKSLCRRILAHFDFFCKEFLIANCCGATNLRNYMLKAADMAKEYIRLQKDQIQFTEDNIYAYDEIILLNLQAENFEYEAFEDTCSNVLHPTRPQADDLVGLGGDLTKIKERLIGPLPELEIIPIVGMGGIGKTTLTRRVYEDRQIISNFHVRAWTTVCQEYNERNVLLGLLQSIASLPKEVLKEDKEQLAERLYRRLKGWRYFIVIDDIWNKESWDQIKLCFPDDCNGSRIVLTTRVTKVASYVNPKNPPHFMKLLSIEDSWDLLCKRNGKEACPTQLVSVGKRIVEKCQGLPLAIEVVAGHLSNIGKTQERWEDIANRMGMPIEIIQVNSLFNIFSVSYNDLPRHLKACFLSMVIFPKNSQISTRKLIKLWAAMGFLPPKLQDSMEEVPKEVIAMKCLEDLIDRNLIMVKKRRFDGQVKICGIHDLLWDLSMREVRKEGNLIFGDTTLCHSFFNTSDGIRYAMGLTRTLFYFDQSFELDCPINSAGFQPLRVLDILNQSFDNFPHEIIGLVNLRYLALATCSNIPATVSKLRYLETLINNHERAGSILPKEIWLLACLRHLQIGICTYLTEPTIAEFEGICSVLTLPDLQTISNLSIDSCTKEVFIKIPNLKKLGIHETGEEDEEDELLFSSLNNLAYLHQLEILKLCCNPALERPRNIPAWNSFLTNIKQLTLIRSNLLWIETKALAMLQNLEVLKLKKNAFIGPEWEMEDEEFLHLQFLRLESLDLMHWKAESDNFPVLRCLSIVGCGNLTGIPIGMGQISTLRLIDLEYCNTATALSVKGIQRDQMDMGNDKFVLRITHFMHVQQLFGLAMAFVYMTLRLKMLWAKNGGRKRKGKDTIRKTEVYVGDSSLTIVNDD